MKLHLCCGEVYLHGWHNVDHPAPGYAHLAANRPDLVVANGTDLEHYYLYEFGQRPQRQCVADELIDIRDLDCPKASCSRVLMISSLEHFHPDAARELCRRIRSWLRPGGEFAFDVPNLLDICRNLGAAGPDAEEQWVRQLYGSGRDDLAQHRWGYTQNMLCRLVLESGFHSCTFGPIMDHAYSMLGCRAVRE